MFTRLYRYLTSRCRQCGNKIKLDRPDRLDDLYHKFPESNWCRWCNKRKVHQQNWKI